MNNPVPEISKTDKNTAPKELLKQIPSIGSLLQMPEIKALSKKFGRQRTKAALAKSADSLRKQILDGPVETKLTPQEYILASTGEQLAGFSEPNIRPAVNATGIVLHTALGRSVWPKSVVKSLTEDLNSFVTLAIDRTAGTRSERDNRLEDILTEITGAEAAAVVNNNAGATLLVLAALAADKEVVISRGQLIEIGGAFRLPDVMAAAGAKMVEIGTTNRTHLRDYTNAVTEETAMLFRAHPSNFRVVGFSGEVDIESMAKCAHDNNLIAVDDLGAGALVNLSLFNLPYEPTVQASIAAGADIALFSGDKLIGASQAGIIVGKAEYIEKIRRHPLHRALRADKTCLMALERTLEIFARAKGDIEILKNEHPLYKMFSLDNDTLKTSAETLADKINTLKLDGLNCDVAETEDFPGGGAMPMQAMCGWAVKLSHNRIEAGKLAEDLRLDESCVFSRVCDNSVMLHLRTIFDGQDELIAAALERIAGELPE